MVASLLKIVLVLLLAAGLLASQKLPHSLPNDGFRELQQCVSFDNV